MHTEIAFRNLSVLLRWYYLIVLYNISIINYNRVSHIVAIHSDFGCLCVTLQFVNILFKNTSRLKNIIRPQ